MISLEEAFINLDTDDDQSQEHIIENNGDTIQNEVIPPFLFKGLNIFQKLIIDIEKIPNFLDQLSAVFLQKIYNSQKNKISLLLTFLPLVFIVGGIVINNNNQDKKV